MRASRRRQPAPAWRNAWPAFGSSRAVNMITFIWGLTRVISRHALQCVDVREMHIEHNHVGLETLRRLQQRAAVRRSSHNLEIQCQQPAEGFHDVRVIVCEQDTGSRWTIMNLRWGYRFSERHDGGRQEVRDSPSERADSTDQWARLV